MACVYRIWSRETLHYYIGATDDIRKRENGHRKDIERGKKPKRWKQLWAQYPELRDPDNWVMDVVKEFETMEEAASAESSLLQIHVGLPLCLNQRRTGATDGCLTQAARSKVSAAKLGVPRSDETRAKLSGENNGMFGKMHSAEAKRKMSEARRGENHPNWGKQLSIETRAKIRENHRGMTGKRHSAETRAKMRETWARKRAEKAVRDPE